MVIGLRVFHPILLSLLYFKNPNRMHASYHFIRRRRGSA